MQFERTPTLSRRTALLALGLLASPAARADGPGVRPARLRRLLEGELEVVGRWAKGFGGSLGAAFVDPKTSAELAGYAPDVPLNPASNQKLVTAAAALRALGPGYTFTTTLAGHIAGGRVAELVVRGHGDPSLRRTDLAALARRLREQGVTEVGDIAIDQSAFDEAFVPPGFEQQPGEWAAFRAPVSAVAVDRNTVLIGVAPGASGAPARVEIEPAGYADTEGHVTTGPRGSRSAPRIALAPKGDGLVARLSGSVPEGSRPFYYRQRAEDPRLLAGYALKSELSDAGIAVRGSLRIGAARGGAELAAHRSPQLAELLLELGKESDNFYAEMLLKVIGAESRGRPGTSRMGALALMALLERCGALEPGVRIGNGSGLFDANRLTARSLARLLAVMHKDQAVGGPFRRQLAIGGVDGTLARRFGKLAERRAVLAKTGTLRDVIALSGYVVGPDESRPIAFSLILNGVAGRTGAARQRIDRVVELAASELWSSEAPERETERAVGG